MTKVVDMQGVDHLITKPAKLSLQDRIRAMEHRIEYRRMVDFEDREAVYKLRRDAYARHSGDSSLWVSHGIDEMHEENSTTIGLFIDNRLAGSFKITVITAEYPDCQSRTYFREDVDALLAKGNMIIDPGRFVADPQAALDYPELPFLLMKVPVMACQYFRADKCFSHVSKEHSSFYRRMFNARVISGPEWYEPLQLYWLLMISDVDRIYDNVFQRFPFWKADYLEMRQIFGPLETWPVVHRHAAVA